MFSSWTPDNFFNISRIDLNPHELWIPDIIFFTQLSGSHFNQDFPSQPALLFDGMTMVLKPFRTELVCVMDVWFFPYDRQVSDLLLPSLTITLNCIFKNVENNYIPSQFEPELKRTTKPIFISVLYNFFMKYIKFFTN